MNNSILKQKRLLVPLLALLIACQVQIETRAQCSAPTLSFHSPVLLTGTDGQPGAVYLFQNVIPNVDAHIEILGLYGGATLYNIDDSAGIGYYDAFQPYVGAAANDTSFIDWKITFKVGGTNDDTALACLAVTGVDVDGDGAYLQEFIEAATPGSIAVDPFTILNVTFDGVRSKAVSTIYNIPLIDSAHHEAMFQMNFTNISTLLYRNGAISTYGSQQIRQTCIYFKPFFSTSTYTLLPVKLLSFTARHAGNYTRVEWSASNEIDTKRYIVQKSADGRTWSDIETINAAGSKAVNNYAVVDKEEIAAKSYYRLKQVDSHDRVTYSKIISMENSTTLEKLVSHNTVVRDAINFQIQSTVKDEYTVGYFSVTGRKIRQDKLQINPGVNSKTVHITSEFSPGIYFVVIKNSIGAQVHSSKLVKN